MNELTGAILIVGVPDNVPDIRYITGFAGTDPAVYLQHGNRKHFLVSRLDTGRAARTVDRAKVAAFEDMIGGSKKKLSLTACVLALLRSERLKSVTVAREFPVGLARDLERGGIRVEVAEDVLFPGRAVKTPAEIEKIRQCQLAAVKAMRKAVRMIADSRVDGSGYLRRGSRVLSSGMVRRAIDMELFRNNCVASGTTVACGRASADPHARGSGPLRARAGIVIDIFPRGLKHGYWGDMTRTIVKGKAPARLKKMYEAVRSAQEAALSVIRPGVCVKTVHDVVQKEFLRLGFQTGPIGAKLQGFIHSTGHGIGLAVHEPPRLSSAPGRLKAGHVITVEPGLYYSDTGGVRIEDTVVVTSGGWRYLGVCRKVLEV